MKDASQYPITFGYRATDGQFYYTPTAQHPKGANWIGNYHRGNDRAMPVGTPIVINGNQIGLSGNTGASSGAHLHIGAFIGGGDVDPTPYEFRPGTVTEIGEDSVNGKFVRVQVGGASVVYLHMSQQTAVKGQDLNKGGNMPSLETDDTTNLLYAAIFHRAPEDAVAYSSWRDKPVVEVINSLYNSGEWKGIDANLKVNDGDVVNLYHFFLDRDPEPGAGSERIGKLFKDNVYDVANSDEAKAVRAARAAKDKLIADLQATDQVDKATIQKQLDQIAKLDTAVKNSGGLDPTTKAQISQTNTIVMKIWDFLTARFK